MKEYSVYGLDGLFHQVVKKSQIMNGRYQIVADPGDVNANNLLSGLEFPRAKWPAVICLAPVSNFDTVQQAPFENFDFTLFFLTTTHSTGDNKTKSPDKNTNSSLHTVPMDWSDMKDVALNFVNAIELLQKVTQTTFRVDQRRGFTISRVSSVANDKLSGVMLRFKAGIAVDCEFEDIDPTEVDLSAVVNHEKHFH